MTRGAGVRASRAGFVGVVLVALLGLGAFLWLDPGSRAPRREPAQAVQASAEPVRAGAELVPAPGTTEPVRVERKEPPPEVVPVARTVAPPAPPPGFGSVVVEVFAADGSPAEDGTKVRLRRVSGKPRPARRRAAPAADAEATVEGGRARFEGVALGRELELSAYQGLAHATATVVGPRSAGESVSVVLRLALEGTTLVFRAVDPGGQPVVGNLETEVLVVSETLTLSRRGWSVTDDRGSFEVELQAALLEDGRRELVVRALVPTDERRERAGALAGRIDLSQDFLPGRIDMGYLVLDRAQLVAAGRVVDGGGKPLANVLVSYSSSRATREGEPLSSLAGSVNTDQLGTFALYGFVDAPRIEVHAFRGDRRVEPVEVAAGAIGLEIVLSAGGGLAGELLLDEDSAHDPALRIALSSSKTPQWPKAALDGGGAAFEFLDLAPGTYTLRVTIRGELRAEVTGLEVVEGEVARDPRIQALDVRGMR